MTLITSPSRNDSSSSLSASQSYNATHWRFLTLDAVLDVITALPVYMYTPRLMPSQRHLMSSRHCQSTCTHNDWCRHSGTWCHHGIASLHVHTTTDAVTATLDVITALPVHMLHVHTMTACLDLHCSWHGSPTVEEKIQTYSSSRSSKLINLDANRKHICNFILSLMVNLGVSPTAFEILTHKGSKYLVFPPSLVWRPRSGGTLQNLWMKLTPQKLEGWSYGENFIILTWTVLDWSASVTDTQPDRRMGDSI